MSLLSSFFVTHLVNALEDEFVKRSPELQEAFVENVRIFSGEVLQWIDSKVSGDAQ